MLELEKEGLLDRLLAQEEPQERIEAKRRIGDKAGRCDWSPGFDSLFALPQPLPRSVFVEAFRFVWRLRR